ncbi:kinase [Gymnopilus dilepis]|uniref:Kinase n=1 Tax=Gymnopilus dilepis TaxID=231916 RepID=A0A409VXA9_9AGAR|nr:kinase [Gymnopilus dilepis]
MSAVGYVFLTGLVRFTVSHVLGKRYCVVQELRSGSAFQLLRVLDVKTESINVVKVISRSLVDEKIVDGNMKWLRKWRCSEARHVQLLADFKTPFNWYLVFDCPKMTLKDVLACGDMCPMPARHVRAIAHQLIAAVSALHRRGMMHLDICPASIEITNAATTREWRYSLEGSFLKKVVLECCQIRLVFYGDAGIGTDVAIGSDQYRAPELVFGWASKFRTDSFSIGCVFAEMLTGDALFPPCHQEEHYMVAKAHLFEAVLGGLPADVVYRISLMHEGLFNSSDELRGFYDLSAGLRIYLSNARNIQNMIEDECELEVLTALTMISSSRRPRLSHVSSFTYFSRAE